MNSPIPVKPAVLPNDVRAIIAQAMGYADEASLYYWGTGGASKRFDDTCAALAGVCPAAPVAPVTGGEWAKEAKERARERALPWIMEGSDDVEPMKSTALIQMLYSHEIAARSHAATQSGGRDSERLDANGDELKVGQAVWCDGERTEVIGFDKEGVEVKFFSQMGDRRCHTEVREANELEIIKDAAASIGGREGSPRETLTPPAGGA